MCFCNKFAPIIVNNGKTAHAAHPYVRIQMLLLLNAECKQNQGDAICASFLATALPFQSINECVKCKLKAFSMPIFANKMIN